MPRFSFLKSAACAKRTPLRASPLCAKRLAELSQRGPMR
jgi:hypothetical protein